MNEIIKKNFFKTPFYFAIEQENIEIIQLLLENSKIDLQVMILFMFFIKFIYIYFNCVLFFLIYAVIFIQLNDISMILS